MSPSSAEGGAGVTPDESDQGLGASSQVESEAAPTNAGSVDEPPRRRDGIDLLLALFDRMGTIVPALLILALGAGVSYLGAICVTTALLRRSAAAQNFFVDLLIAMMWPGVAILVTIGVGIAIFSVVQLALWPRGWAWRWLAWRLGAPVAWATTLLWATTVFVEAYLVGWGFELWARPQYVALRAALRLAPTSDGLLLVSVLLAPLIALLPEWCARFGLTRLVGLFWRSAPA
jgi:hypothetical protein